MAEETFMKEMKETFDELDTDHSGTIDFEEFHRALGKDLQSKDVESFKMFFSLADSDENGALDFPEFLKLMTALDAMPDNSDKTLYETLFRLIDDDNSGTLETNELARFMRVAKKGMSDEEIKTALNVMDEDSDGHVTMSEFVSFFA
ncbi:caltractin, putative [Entamoeba invadens IP1]|uniref:caltractin, putative n=1 Tax=Entamoeba invadens IP1 TaxID=370355 RepID=UPI0002C3ED9E|nr:caltractin, putative [Entamoeba invadens IP1]ELP93596.1 caltractin, putative [Entamoeba invadens IP1]|eukprot:XP_004260367.1 caltractin, putative [Entamoeba invadens IP1]